MSVFPLPVLAAIRSAPPSLASPGATPSATPQLIRDVAPPVDYFPYPMWVVVCAGVLLLAIAVTGIYVIYRLAKSTEPPELPRPRAIAMAELARLREQVRKLASYDFSIAVSDVLRRFAEGQYRIPALEQTSPEFLAGIAKIPTFSPRERDSIAEFLERCDALKFGRAEGDETVNERLLESATAFVQGGALT